MEEDIQNYLPTVMFRGTPCSSINPCRVSLFDLKISNTTELKTLEFVFFIPITWSEYPL